MELPWKKWIGMDNIIDVSEQENIIRGRPLSSAFAADGTPRVINEETIAAARAANRDYEVPAHALASLANPKRQVVAVEKYLAPAPESKVPKDWRGGPVMSALPTVAAVGLAGYATSKLLGKLRVELEEPLWALSNLGMKNLESYGDSDLLRLLPEEVLLAVASKLAIADRLRLASTCRKLYQISTLPSVWTSVDLSGSGPAVSKIFDKELWRLVRRSQGAEDASKEPPLLKGRPWRKEKLKEAAVVAPPQNGGAAGGGIRGGPPGGIILASVNQLRSQQGQGEVAQVPVPPSSRAVVDATWGYAGGVEENKGALGRGDLLSTSFPLRYLDIRGCAQISSECLTSIIAHSASSAANQGLGGLPFGSEGPGSASAVWDPGRGGLGIVGAE